jgi:dual specificity phosphatase 12
MGKSRSVTIAVAYLLRQFPHHTVGSALKQIRESRPIAEPNDGFMAQLELYKKMGCPRNIENHPLYQKWLFQIEVELAVAAGLGPSTVRFEDEQIQEERRSVRREIELRCKKCRYAFCAA